MSLLVVLLVPANEPCADPILKPKKYHGPIPRKSFGLSIGFLGGPDNAEMYDFLASQIDQPLQSRESTDDFGSAPQFDAYYSAKVHPNFGVRARGGLAYLSSESTGYIISTVPDTSGTLPLLAFDRTFDVLLFSLEASAMYYFQDASVSEFQTYVGVGFTFFFPWAQYEATNTLAMDDGTGNIVDTGQEYSRTEESKGGFEPGVNGVLGALYHVRNNLAFFAEGRYQIGQSKFSLDLPTQNAGVQNLNFDVDYSGFVLAIGASRFF